MAKQQPKKEKAVISVLLPTRGRREVLRKSLDSLVSKATHPERIEILFYQRRNSRRFKKIRYRSKSKYF